LKAAARPPEVGLRRVLGKPGIGQVLSLEFARSTSAFRLGADTRLFDLPARKLSFKVPVLSPQCGDEVDGRSARHPRARRASQGRTSPTKPHLSSYTHHQYPRCQSAAVPAAPNSAPRTIPAAAACRCPLALRRPSVLSARAPQGAGWVAIRDQLRRAARTRR
jgi:hypothetical protein